MTVRKCSTCKHYEPAPIWRKGWCRNPLLYSPQQSHLVGEDDLDCDRGMGNYWEPLDADESALDVGETREVAAAATWMEQPAREPTVAPLRLSPSPRHAGDLPTARGGEMSHFSGPGGRDNLGDDDLDEVRRVPPSTERAPRTAPGPQSQHYTYYSEERYWTDYLRIAAPVLGVILMLGLAWWWISNLLGDNTAATPTTGPETPDVIMGNTAGTPTGSAVTPIPQQTAGTGQGSSTPSNSGTIAAGVKVVVANTGGTGVNMREDASTTAAVVTTLEEGAEIEVTGDSVTADGYTWWPVKTADGTTGYVVDDYVEPSQ